MIQVKDILFSLFTGILIGLGWWAFLDGTVSAPDAFPVAHLVPALLISLCVVMINAVNPNNMANNQVKVWLFVWFTLACVSVGFAIWITAVEYPPDDNWPGVTIIIMTTLVFMAGLLFFGSRRNK
jgi:L-asparagine transporter-like permease